LCSRTTWRWRFHEERPRVTIALADPGMLPDVPELCFADERKG
jgi:hypothetical protein